MTSRQQEVAEDSEVRPVTYDLYEKRRKIYARKVEGLYQRIRVYAGWVLLAVFLLLPWLNVDGRQSVLLDLPSRKFHILWLTFWPQDFILLAMGLMIAAFTLFFVTTWLGRVWCGYTCPQTVWTELFMWVERMTEGDRTQRMRLDKAPWSVDKLLTRAAKHSLWLLFAFITSFTFVGYFYGVRDLADDISLVRLPLITLFWLGLFTLFTYINAGWMREQVCLYMCPYARFQSAMFDSDTLIVSYDPSRGEPRGSRKRGIAPDSVGLGDCIDCEQCVQVCPTGIDIRDGLQYECISCALCIDACDGIMGKMGYAKGLISYNTENRLAGRAKRLLRPKLIGYAVVMCIMIVLFTSVLVLRNPVELDVIRDRGRLYEITMDGMIQNVYTLKILNMSHAAHDFRVIVKDLEGARLGVKGPVTVAGGEIRNVPITVRVDRERIRGGIHEIEFRVQALDDATIGAESESRFIVPQRHETESE